MAKAKKPVKKSEKKPAQAISPGRQRVFKLIALLLPIVFLIMLEVLLRLFGYGGNLKLFIPNEVEGYEKYMIVNPEIGRKYFQKLEYTSPANDIFLKKKPENTFRVFVMGSSVVYGFPYDRNIMFSRILHQQLEDAWPGKRIEMVNTSITAINSFTLRDFIGQILAWSPDAILIYEGHNEFYGAFGIGSNETMSRNRSLVKLHLWFMDFRTYQMFRQGITSIAMKIARAGAEKTTGTLMKRIVANADILLHSNEYNITMRHYRQNMSEVLNHAAKKGVPVFYSEMVSNINGMEPFNSMATDTLEAAADVYNRARLAEADGDYESAFNLYYRAKDLDCLRFRASEDINQIIGELTKKYNAYKVPMLDHFNENSPNRLIGNNYMTEHVHPNIEGNFLMAEAFFNAIAASGVLGEQRKQIPSREYYKNNWGVTDLDRLLAHHRIQQLMRHWPFVKDDSQSVSYAQTYRTRGFVDSLAFNVMRNPSLDLTTARVQLASRYEKIGRPELAYREYEALLRMNPYIAENYRDAASSLLQLSDLPRALNYYLRSLEFEESFFARFRIGEIYLIKGDLSSAIKYFEQALDLAPEDRKPNVMGKLYAALVYNNQNEQAKTIAGALEAANARQFLQVPPRKYYFDDYIPFQTRDQVLHAQTLGAANRTNEAIDVLLASMNIYRSHIAGRLLAEFYLERKEPEQARRWFVEYYEQFRFDPAYLHSMIMVNLVLEQRNDAAQLFQELKQLDPNYPHLKILSMMLS